MLVRVSRSDLVLRIRRLFLVGRLGSRFFVASGLGAGGICI